MLGDQLAGWLARRVDPSRIYDERILHELAEVGIAYDHNSHQLWMTTGEMVEVKTYTVLELLKHPTIRFAGIGSNSPDIRWVPGFEIAYWLHMLVWPTEEPPGVIPRMNYGQAYLVNVASIAERGALPYRQGVM